MCVVTFKDLSPTMPQLGSTLQVRQEVPVGTAAGSWMDAALLPACLPALRFIPDIRRYQSEELGSADMRKSLTQQATRKKPNL